MVLSANGSSNGRGPGALTYAEVRRMARWLGPFTARDLGGALRVTSELANQFVKALLFHRLAHDTGAVVNGPDGDEPVFEMDPLPEGIVNRERRTPPEIVAVRAMGGLILYNYRGLPVRIRTERDQRKSLSTPGARQVHKNREREYTRQRQARDQAAEVQRRKQVAKSQGRVYVEEEK